jgi:hypothetical protein
MEQTKSEETKPKEYKQEELNKMNYKQMRQAAINQGQDPTGLSPKQLKLMLGAAPSNATVVDNAEGMSAEEKTRRREEKERVPKKTIYLDKDEVEFWKVRAQNPDAFDNVDFTDKSATSQHVFSRKVKCYCGEKFKIARFYEKKKDGIAVTVEDKNPVDFRNCPKCGRIYYYHEPDAEREIFADRLA